MWREGGWWAEKYKKGLSGKGFKKDRMLELLINLEAECLSICRLGWITFWSEGLRQHGAPGSLGVVWCGLRQNASKRPASERAGESGLSRGFCADIFRNIFRIRETADKVALFV